MGSERTSVARRGKIGWAVLFLTVLGVAACTQPAPIADTQDPELTAEPVPPELEATPTAQSTVVPTTPTRGLAVLASDIGDPYAVDDLAAFITAGSFGPIFVDWAWITHHWDRTDFGAVQELVQTLKGRGVHVAAMYRPRFLQNPTVPVQVKSDGSPATSHGHEIRFTSPEARDWGAAWGREILRRCPGFDEIVIYNPRNMDRSPEADPDAPYAPVAQFLEEARAAWRDVNPGVRLGVVYMNDPGFWGAVIDVIDVAHPFLLVQEDTDVGVETFEATRLAPVLGDKAGAYLAKVTWGENDKVAPAYLQAFDAHTRQYGFSYVFWTFGTLFDSELYDPSAVARALGLDFARLEPPLRTLTGSSRRPATTNRETAVSQGRNSPKDWVYFVSRDNSAGRPPELVLTLAQGEWSLPAVADSLLISYLADRAWGSHRQLSISMNDSNRVLLGFDLSSAWQATVQKAELVLDTRLSQAPPKDPFDIGVYRVTEVWYESSANWQNQPAFDATPVTTLQVEPRAGIVQIDVTELVHAWFEGVPNYGLLIKVTEPLGELPVQSASRSSSTGAPPEISLPPMEQGLERLPWPHQPPGLSATELAALNRSVWIINDFPLYQGDDTRAYFHTGLDIVLENGTPIYAMKDGWVKSVAHSTVTVGDAQDGKPAFGWNYTHLGDTEVAAGDFVQKGTRIGRVEFDGLPHIHLDKVYSQGQHWGEWHYMLMPNGHFSYPDDDPPVIQTPFHLLRNESDRPFSPDASGNVVVHGDVDIVVGMREQGLYAHSRENESGDRFGAVQIGHEFGDRLGVARMEYEIRGVETGASHRFASFDFTGLAIKKAVLDRSYNTELTKIVYKKPRLFEPGHRTGNRDLNYYILTNCPSDGAPRELDPRFARNAWRTAARDAQGQPVFPNGPYDITVTAADFSGHTAFETIRVTVRNSGGP